MKWNSITTLNQFVPNLLIPFAQKMSAVLQGNILKFPVYAPEGVLWAFKGAAVSSPQRGLETMQFVRFKTEEEDQ